MKKRIVITSVFVIMMLTITLSINAFYENKISINKNIIKENNVDTLSIYLEQEEAKYSKATIFPSKGDKYVLNTNKSMCDGNTNISWNREKWGLELSNIDKKDTKCYLYFDKEKTIEDIILKNNPKTEQPDFSNGATTDEGLYSINDGMYGGTSYYWRGTVTNNYVKFAGFCWRIVRINGDKTMRLIYDGTTCHANGTYTKDSIAVENVQYNSLKDKSYYVGWTYVEGKQRPEAGDTPIDSNAKTQTENWYKLNIENNEINASKVAAGKFCNDRDVGTVPSNWGDNYTNTWNTDGLSFIYAAYERYTAHTPTLNCSQEDIYTLKVGLITLDELEMAGGAGSVVYYLYNGQRYWTITPYYWDGFNNVSRVYNISQFGNLFYPVAPVHASELGIRPVINLNSDVILSGNGTIDNPYEVV